MMKEADDRVIVALDHPDADEAMRLVRTVGDAAGFYKIGLGMIVDGGFDLAVKLKNSLGKRVFLDMKLFDIGNTVSNAVQAMIRLEPDLLTVHGDPSVVSAAVRARGGSPTRILAVTVLTSADRGDLDASLVEQGTVREIVLKRARHAFDAGADGVICSVKEAAAIRSMPGAGSKLLVTPGIRPAGMGQDDQKRTSTPAEAIEAGADHMVIGRPVTAATDPLSALRSIYSELRQTGFVQP